MAHPNSIATGISNLNPANRKGKTGARKKLTKSLLEWLDEIIEDNKDAFRNSLASMAATDPEKHAKTMTEIYKLVVPRQIQAEVNMSGELNQGPPVINFNFGDSKKPEASEAAEVSDETIYLKDSHSQQPFKLVFPQPVKIIDIDSEEVN